MRKKFTVQLFTSILLLTIVVAILLSCNRRRPAVVGTYKMYSDDPSVQAWIAGENTYIKLNSDNTIVYNSTINGKQKFHFNGSFVLDEKTNELTIQWKEGKLPDKLLVQQIGPDYFIQIGTTKYKKEKTGS